MDADRSPDIRVARGHRHGGAIGLAIRPDGDHPAKPGLAGTREDRVEIVHEDGEVQVRVRIEERHGGNHSRSPASAGQRAPASGAGPQRASGRDSSRRAAAAIGATAGSSGAASARTRKRAKYQTTAARVPEPGGPGCVGDEQRRGLPVQEIEHSPRGSPAPTRRRHRRAPPRTRWRASRDTRDRRARSATRETDESVQSRAS